MGTDDKQSSFVDVATRNEIQRNLRVIKQNTASRLVVMMATHIHNDVNRSYDMGRSLSVSDASTDERVNSMDVSLPDVFVKWLRTTRLLESHEASTLKNLIGGNAQDVDISPVNMGLSGCEGQMAKVLFSRFLNAIYLHIIVGQGFGSQNMSVSEETVVKRITEVLESITPTSNYFCRREAKESDVPKGVTAEKLFIDDDAERDENKGNSGSGNGDENARDTRDVRHSRDDGDDPDDMEVGKGNGSVSPLPSESDYSSDSSIGSDSVTDVDDRDRERPGNSDEESESSKRSTRSSDPDNAMHLLSKEKQSSSNFVKEPRKPEIDGDVVRRGWKGAKSLATTAIDGVKMAFRTNDDDDT
jgi:hypothetical protein